MPEVYGSASRCFEHRWKVGEGVTNASGESALIPGESGDGVTNASVESALIPGESGDGVMSASGESALIPGESGDGGTIGEIREGVVGGAVGGASCYTTRESVVVQVGRSEATCSQAGETNKTLQVLISYVCWFQCTTLQLILVTLCVLLTGNCVR